MHTFLHLEIGRAENIFVTVENSFKGTEEKKKKTDIDEYRGQCIEKFGGRFGVGIEKRNRTKSRPGVSEGNG